MTRAMQKVWAHLEAIARLEDAVDAWKWFRNHGVIDEHYESILQELRIDMEMAETNLFNVERSKS